jgi:hypothetical protein
MKRRVLLKRLDDEGCELVRHGANHDWYRNVITGAMDAVPRHAEINELTALKIIRHLSAPDPSR